MNTTAILDPEGATFTMARGAWSATYPLTDLQKWLAFYCRRAEFFPHQAAYSDDCHALEDLKRKLSQHPL